MGNRIGIDVGGTNVKIALVNDKGSIIYSNRQTFMRLF